MKITLKKSQWEGLKKVVAAYSASTSTVKTAAAYEKKYIEKFFEDVANGMSIAVFLSSSKPHVSYVKTLIEDSHPGFLAQFAATVKRLDRSSEGKNLPLPSSHSFEKFKWGYRDERDVGIFFDKMREIKDSAGIWGNQPSVGRNFQYEKMDAESRQNERRNQDGQTPDSDKIKTLQIGTERRI